MSPIDVAAATDNRDSLAKTLYSRLFDWLVEKINTSIGQDPNAATMVGVLDIYGASATYASTGAIRATVIPALTLTYHPALVQSTHLCLNTDVHSVTMNMHQEQILSGTRARSSRILHTAFLAFNAFHPCWWSHRRRSLETETEARSWFIS